MSGGVFLYTKPMLSARALNGSASLIATSIDCRFFYRAEGIMFKMSKTGGTGSLKIQYAISRDGSTVDGSFIGNYALVTCSTTDFPNSAKVWNAIALPNIIAPYVFFKFSGASGNPATGVTIDAEMVVRGSLLG